MACHNGRLAKNPLVPFRAGLPLCRSNSKNNGWNSSPWQYLNSFELIKNVIITFGGYLMFSFVHWNCIFLAWLGEHFSKVMQLSCYGAFSFPVPGVAGAAWARRAWTSACRCCSICWRSFLPSTWAVEGCRCPTWDVASHAVLRSVSDISHMRWPCSWIAKWEFQKAKKKRLGVLIVCACTKVKHFSISLV